MKGHEPNAALEEIERDKIDTTYEIERLLYPLAQKHGISVAVIEEVVARHVDPMLEEVFRRHTTALLRKLSEASDN